jgi:hypothetical protein
MSFPPFGARPADPETDRRRARLVLAIAAVGIAAMLLAYAISPGVRHAVGHAAHSVSHALDRDAGARKRPTTPTSPTTPATPATPAKKQPAQPKVVKPTTTGAQ